MRTRSMHEPSLFDQTLFTSRVAGDQLRTVATHNIQAARKIPLCLKYTKTKAGAKKSELVGSLLTK